jgi:hypothetical protein
MRNITDFTGRLGNQMFMYAFIHAERRRRGVDPHFPNSPEFAGEYLEEVIQQFRGGIGPRDDRVSIHVRRGDFLHKQMMLTLDAYYYKCAVSLFPHSRFLVFCRDRQGEAADREAMEWCRCLGPSTRGFEFSAGLNEYDDLNAMAACQHNIIANSTFSLWAALLNPNPHKRVVAPAVWDKTGWAPHMPADWTRL